MKDVRDLKDCVTKRGVRRCGNPSVPAIIPSKVVEGEHALFYGIKG